MDIKIGNNNKINNSSIGQQVNLKADESENGDKEPNSKSFSQRHPILLSVIVSIGCGFVLLFSFWKNIINFIESLF